MICAVCGKEYQGNDACPACGFQNIGGFVGGDNAAIKEKIDAVAAVKRAEMLNGISVYAIGYIFQEKDGKIVLDSRQEILLADNLENLRLNQINWSPVEYGKQEAGEPMQVDVVVKTPAGNKNCSLQAKGPSTSGFWKLGFIMKPGFEFSLAVGDSSSHSETNSCRIK